MAIYQVQNQWGGSSAPWHAGGTWVLGGRDNQNVVEISIVSGDGGKTFSGTMTYEGEGPIGLKATQIVGNNYSVENQWGGSSAPWHPGGNWIIGGRDGQNVVKLDVKSVEGSANLEGKMTYAGEGPIGFDSKEVPGSSYAIENQWGGASAPWHQGGTFVLGSREGQNPVAFNIDSTDGGKTFSGTMTYDGEGPIGFRAVQISGNNYAVENQWGGPDAPWHPGGNLVIGARVHQNAVQLKITSSDKGQNFTGEMTYAGEGPIGVKATISSNILSGATH
ncbi:lectin ESA-2 [Flavobacteriaceae bacterium (ex Bugula neritina AB1)]|nr:lectin ESA-2 [Flavobacteriaceae bacterium (ex Bugula neritina AB1)]